MLHIINPKTYIDILIHIKHANKNTMINLDILKYIF